MSRIAVNAMSGVARILLCITIALEAVFALAGALFAVASPPAHLDHWYEIATPKFFADKDEAIEWARDLKRRIGPQVPRCDFAGEDFEDLFHKAVKDPHMHVIQVRMKDLGQEKEMILSVTSESEDIPPINIRCGTRDSEACAKMYEPDAANDVGEHEHACHQGGKTCAAQN